MELVSVVIPSYGGGKHLRRAVDSVLKQTYENIEIIVVDDNGVGTENQLKTAHIMEEYRGNPKVRYVCHEVNINGSAARNTGVKYAKGKYIALLDDDDAFNPENIEKHMKVMCSLPADYALTYCSDVSCRGDVFIDESHVSKSGELFYEVCMHQVVIGSSALLIKKEAWENLGGFDESFRRHQDWEFTARVAHRYKIKAVDHIGYIRYLEYRNSPKNYETAKKYRVHYIEKMMPYIETLSKKQQREVITSNYVGVMMQLLRTGKIGKFIKEYRSFKLGLYGIPFVVKSIFSYIFINKNFWTLRKRK
ncbi:MAG: glycosyltransferase [Clostridia bacterium]|nr:glycosyltransferase [Clostridia bacterium]